MTAQNRSRGMGQVDQRLEAFGVFRDQRGQDPQNRNPGDLFDEVPEEVVLGQDVLGREGGHAEFVHVRGLLGPRDELPVHMLCWFVIQSRKSQ